MRVISKLGREDIAVVHIAQSENGRLVEFVESVEPPIPRTKKWVNIVSTLFGCPVNCPSCDAGSRYHGKLSKEEILFQIDYLVWQRFPNGVIPAEKWKIQFARMGEPSFNKNVLDVLEILPKRYTAPGLLPSISTVAPEGTDNFFTRLLEIKRRLYSKRFQFQFSLHSTDEAVRRRLIPVETWSLSKMAEYGNQLYEAGDRKITLNFALTEDVPIDPDVLLAYFDPDIFIIKVTPLNPTYSADKNILKSLSIDGIEWDNIISTLRMAGYDVIVSVGELEENAIGSNCGQYVSSILDKRDTPMESYTYAVEKL